MGKTDLALSLLRVFDTVNGRFALAAQCPEQHNCGTVGQTLLLIQLSHGWPGCWRRLPARRYGLLVSISQRKCFIL